MCLTYFRIKKEPLYCIKESVHHEVLARKFLFTAILLLPYETYLQRLLFNRYLSG
ncbi:hypothetical protein LLB_0540 [Legionella longbeachae D-4968]|nr:hypothetical protein LLB_0540 [Legionella longbeachae D-4968]